MPISQTASVSRFTADEVLALDELREQIARIIGRNLTADEVRRLLGNPEALDSIRFDVDKVLHKVASWYK